MIDLKPFAEDARKRMATAVAEFRAQGRASPPMSPSTISYASGSASPTTTRPCALIADANGEVNVVILPLAWQ